MARGYGVFCLVNERREGDVRGMSKTFSRSLGGIVLEVVVFGRVTDRQKGRHTKSLSNPPHQATMIDRQCHS